MKTFIVIVMLIFSLGAVGIVQRADAQTVMGAGIYNTLSPVFSYTGTWVTSTSAEYFNGDVQRTSALNGEVEFYVFGSDVTIYGARATSGSNNVLLCIDDVCSNISFYAASTSFGIVAEINGLDYGTTKINLINQQSGFNIFFDAIFVEDYQIEPTIQFEVIVTAEFSLPETTPEPLPSYMEEGFVNGQPVVFQNSISSGDQMIFIVLGIIAFLSLVGVLIQIWMLKSKSAP